MRLSRDSESSFYGFNFQCIVRRKGTTFVNSFLTSDIFLCYQDNASADLAEYHNILFSCFVEHETSRSEAFRECIKFHDDLLSSIDTLRVKVEKLETQQASKWDQLQEAKASLEGKLKSLNFFYKGFYFFSIPMNAKSRSENIHKMMSYVGASMLVTSHSLQSSSAAFLDRLAVNATQAISDTSHCLDVLALKPLGAGPEELPNSEGPPPHTSWICELYANASGKTVVGGAAAAAVVSSSSNTTQRPQTSPAKVSTAAAAPVSPVAEVKTTNPFGEPNEPEPAHPPAVVEHRPVNQDLLGSLMGGPAEDKAKVDRNADLFG